MPAHSRKTIILATDQQQSVLHTLGAIGPCSSVYTPYGHRPQENGLLSLIGFNGQLPDALTGHYHLGNGYRQFNPVLMRFNSPDSWSPFGDGGLNAYAYCVGDPVNMSDPTGHIPNLITYIFKKLGIKNHPSIQFTEQQLIKTQENTLKNIHIIHATGNTPTDSHLTLVQLDKNRHRDYATLLSNPKHTTGRTPTFTELSPGKRVSTREYYSYLTLDHQPKTPISRLPERAPKVTFNEKLDIHEIERVVPPPPGGWKKAADIRMPKRSTLWSRRLRSSSNQQTP